MRRIYQGNYYDFNEQGVEVPFAFRMDVTLDKQLSFSGTVWEEEFSGISGLQALVKGYIDNNHISFMKQYPCFYGYDETGKAVIDSSKRGHEVIFDGYWNETEGKWTGEWEVEGETEVLTNSEITTSVYLGYFEMQMIE